MARVKGAMMTRKRRKKIIKLAKGYWGAKKNLYKVAKPAGDEIREIRLHRQKTEKA